MVTKISLCGLLLGATSALGQSAITLTESDVPPPKEPFNTIQINPVAKSVSGSNQNWDYSTYVGNNPSKIDYVIETDPFFTAIGVDVYQPQTKALNADFNYKIAYKFDYNAGGVDDKGHFVFRQSYSLETSTGNPQDSIKMVEQKFILSSPRKIMVFPMTANSSWHTVSRRVTNFKLDISAYGFKNTNCQHRYRIIRNDTIVGWGKLTVHTDAGASIPYEVLVAKIEQYAIDSFFVNGNPASTQLKTAFGISQGQITDKQYAYHFYRKGAPNYLLRLNYAADKTYTTLAGAYISTDNLITNGAGELNKMTFQSILFPNPANENEINIKLIGKTIVDPTYTITSISGKTVAEGKANLMGNDLMLVPLNNSIFNGNYFIKIKDSDNNVVVIEQININR